ncbi:1-acyl-sn-glycerol-3-phosphate acyltransferase [Myxococcota bacterium]|nr:1-acyl-sn-glycerol-3-phosphate acyltransferase [Myxococcota bacterium]MCZ7620598.1 1-acyl-sn-glycerol-3-phosphate acyltransferase [Myxococcota bacterium]
MSSPSPPAPARSRTDPVPLHPDADGFYRCARALVALAMRAFFRRTVVRGAENVPERGPLILAANHPNSIVDAFAIGLATPRKVHFLARSTMFDARWRARVLARLGVLPIHRRLDAAERMAGNVEVFQRCHELLEAGGVIGIFPEGISHVDPQVKEMRTGAIRIGFEAEARCGFSLGVRVVPIGLNFSRPNGRRRGELTLRVDAPIALARHEAAYRADPAATVARLTAELRSRIEKLIVHLDDLSKAPIVAAANEVFGPDYVSDPLLLPEIGDEATRRIELRQGIADAIEYYSRYQPAWALGLEQRLTAYREARTRARVTEDTLRRQVGALPLLRDTLPAALIGVVGAPLAGLGWLLNALPRRVTGWIAKRMIREPSQLATYELWIGLQAFAVAYAGGVLLLRHWTEFGRMELALAVLLFPVIGVLSSRYFALMQHYAENLRLTSLQVLRRSRLEQIRFWRQQLARDEEKMRRFLLGEREGGAATD